MDTSLPADPTNTDQNPGTVKGPKGDRDEEVVVPTTAAAPENPDQRPKSPQGPKTGEREGPMTGRSQE